MTGQTTLRWPERRTGRFRDQDASRIAGVVGVDDVPLEVNPGDTITVSDPNAVDHYLDRGFQEVDDSDGGDGDDTGQDGSGGDDQADESADDDFDVEAFVDRTPVAVVVDDIEAGEADGHLDAVAEADDRVTVERAVESRKEQVGG